MELQTRGWRGAGEGRAARTLCEAVFGHADSGGHAHCHSSEEICTLSTDSLRVPRRGVWVSPWTREMQGWRSGMPVLEACVQCPRGTSLGGEWVYCVNSHLSLFKSFNLSEEHAN